jgi:uncharacterized protein
VKPPVQAYVNNRVLKLNVGFLINGGPGNKHLTEFDVPRVRVADDLTLNYIKGPLRLSRTKEGILVQGKLTVGLDEECYRCLDPVDIGVDIEIEELFAYPIKSDIEFGVGEDCVLDLAPFLRAETMIASTRGAVCKPDCLGLCPDCGANLNHAACSCHLDKIDPRLAKLKTLLDQN